MKITQAPSDGLVKPKLEISKRLLDLWMLPDCSGSMDGIRIQILNQAMRESFNELQDVDRQHPEIEMRMRCIAFASIARWHIGPDPVDMASASWKDLSARGCTSTGKAVQMVADEITMDKMPRRGLPPVMVLISDGGNTDGRVYDRAIEQLDKEPWGAKAIRLSIGIGDGYNREQLEKFTNHPEIGVLEARNAVDLANYIRYASVTASIAATRTFSQPGAMNNNVVLPPAPAPAANAGNINLQVL